LFARYRATSKHLHQSLQKKQLRRLGGLTIKKNVLLSSRAAEEAPARPDRRRSEMRDDGQGSVGLEAL
jgi:hypothetical protein